MAGRVQLATRGTQDVFFTDNPEYTYFIKNFKKHTNFARFTVNHDVTGEKEFGKTLRCTIPHDVGDLLKTVRLQVTLGDVSPNGYVESIGHAIIDHIDLVIGGNVIQRVTRDFMQIYSEHYVTQTKQINLSRLIGKPHMEFSGTSVQDATIFQYIRPTSSDRTCIVDVPFYFHNNPELALPLCALGYQEVEIIIQLNKVDTCVYQPTDENDVVLVGSEQKGLIKHLTVQTELVCLDEPERIRFQEVPSDMIITQIQMDTSYIPVNETRHRQKVSFVNPVKELYFIIQNHSANTSVFDYDSDGWVDNSIYTNYEQLKNLQLRLDDEVILDEKSGNVIQLRAVQSGIHHSRTQLFRRFYSYSFALEPERWYPTGQRNCSLIKEQHIDLSLNSSGFMRELRVYALSYNILRIENGTARLLFASGAIGD